MSLNFVIPRQLPSVLKLSIFIYYSVLKRPSFSCIKPRPSAGLSFYPLPPKHQVTPTTTFLFFSFLCENELSWCFVFWSLLNFTVYDRKRLRVFIHFSQVSRMLKLFSSYICIFACKLMERSIEGVRAFIEVDKLPWIQRKLPAACNSFHWLLPTFIDFRLLPHSLHMLSSATMTFRPNRRGGARAAYSLVWYI